MSADYIESSDESDGSSSGNEFFEVPNESNKLTRKRLSTESSTAVSDDEFGLRRKRSMSSDVNPQEYYSPPPVRQRSMSSDINQQGYYSPPPVTLDSERKLSVSSDQDGIGYYSPPPVQSDSERKSSIDSDVRRKYSLSSDPAYYSPPPVLTSDTERKQSVSDSEAHEVLDSDSSDVSDSGTHRTKKQDFYHGGETSADTPGSSKFNFYQNSSDTSDNELNSANSSSALSSSNVLKRSVPPESDDEEVDSKRSRLDSELSEASTAPSRKLSTQSDSSENNFGLPSYKPADTKLYSNVAEKLMQKMGYKEGKGLGKMGQGIVEPIKAFKQEGKRGLGLKIPSLNIDTYRWNPEEEVIELKEGYTWLSGAHLPALSVEDMESWLQEGEKKLSIDNETKFCSPSLLKNMLQCKTVFDDMEGDQFFRARNRSNPWELIKNGPFLNRAAMKMANMDHRFEGMFTNPKQENGSPLLRPGELLYFADVCAGPGGFSEYVLYRKQWRSKGIGFTLTGSHDFKLDDFFAGPSETFQPYYGVKQNGDVYDPENILSLHEFVLKSTKERGVHFMMADGGFSVEGQENIQEILSKRLYLCQFLVSLFIVRPEGHFVCKVFDLFTPFSAGLLYLLYRSYRQVCIFKPNTSRPANSERYIICKWKRSDCGAIRDLMFKLNQRLDRYGSGSKRDIVSCVPLGLMTSDDNFFEYLVTSNNTIAERQVVALAKVRAFYEDTSLTEPKQFELKEESYRLWDIPMTARKASHERPEDVFADLTAQEGRWIGELSYEGQLLTRPADLSVFTYVHDWYYVVMGATFEKSPPAFYLGLGKHAIYKYTPDTGRWVPETGLRIQLSPRTLLFGESVEEFRGQGPAQVKVKTFHIIDAFSLGDRDISHFHYSFRRAECQRFVESLNQQDNPNQWLIRMKTLFSLECISTEINRIQLIKMKNGSTKLGVDMGDGQSCEATGLIFIKATKEPWIRFLSRTQNKKYFNNPLSGVSKFEMIPEAVASFVDCMRSRRVWMWEQGSGMKGDAENKEKPVLHKHQLCSFVHNLARNKK